jgi:DNA-binding ferritin-like protein
LKREGTELVDVVGLLREQLRDTLRLGAYVQYAQAQFRDRDNVVLDLLRNISLELSTLSERIARRATESAIKGTSVINTKAEVFMKGDEDGSLESLLNRFCRYVRKSSERLTAARQAKDSETVALLARILSMANTSIWFLDLYSNAVWIKCPLSPLPKWKPVSAHRQIAS